MCALTIPASQALAQEPAPTGETEVAYETEIRGVTGGVKDLITKSANLYRLKDKPPSSVPALRARVDADLDTIEKILRSEGYYGFRLEHEIDSRARPVKVRIDIDPGPIYRLRTFTMRYEDDKPGRILLTNPYALGVIPGERAKSQSIVDAEGKLVRLLGESGYPFAKVKNRDVVVDHGERAVAVTFDMIAGPYVTIGPITVEGTQRVERAYVNRLIELRPGAMFDLAAIDETRRRLFASGLFDTVLVEWPQSAEDNSALPITVKVTERDRRTLSAGVNYSTTDGAGADFSWTHRNMFGEGERIELGIRISELELSAFADFLKPNFGQLDQDLIGRFETRKQDTDAYEQTTLGGSVGLQRRLSKQWKASLGTGVEAAEVDERRRPVQDYLIFSLPGEASYDGSNDLLDPSRGVRLTFDASPSKVIGDSNANFLLGSVTGRTYYEALPEKQLVLAARARVASLVGAERDDIPASRRLYSGGGGSIRGYKFQTVGPLDTANRPIGGRSLVEAALEARFRVFEDYGIVPFVEGGTAFNDPLPSDQTLRWAAGIGFRYYTSIGPLRLDVATPLNKRAGVDDSFAFYISLGQAF